jgi:adenosylcobinamide-GDP ribazoletransferase
VNEGEFARKLALTVGETGPPASPAPHRSSAETRPGFATLSWTQAPFFALQFLTVLPPLVRRAPQPADLGRSEAFFPLVGLLLGVSLAALDRLLTPFVAPLARDVLLVIVLAALTGALHLDGVIDTFDGLFTGTTPERRLEIMRDPRAGSYGVVAVVLLLALKVAALGSLPPSIRAPALIVAPCLGRWGIVLATGAFAYARPEGMGRDFKSSIRLPHVIVAGAIALGAAGAMAGAPGLFVWTGASLLVLLAGQWVSGRLGGLSGDSYGAICEIIETGALVIFGMQVWSLLG